MAKSVVVAGDLVWHENLVQRLARDSAHEATPLTALHSRVGGARRLASLVRIACVRRRGRHPRSRQPTAPAAARMPYGRCTNGRLEAANEYGESASCWVPSRLTPRRRKRPASRKNQTRTCWSWMIRIWAFAMIPQRWPAALREGGKPRRIILKACAPLGEGLLWKRLLDSHADRLDVVVSVSDLRARGASISQSLSWDRTIEETVAEFETGISSGDLALVRRVVVHFGSAGAASLHPACPARQFGRSLDGPGRVPALSVPSR